MSRRLFIGLVCLALSWASSVNSVKAQPAAKAEKLVRVTYPVADLIMPIEGYPGPEGKQARADLLIQMITKSVAKHSWEQAGGEGSIQFFPFGMAIVVNQPR